MLLAVAAAVLILAAPDARAEKQADQRPARYVAELTDGRRIASDRLTAWHSSSDIPRLDGTPLFDPANPLRWLKNAQRRLPEPPEAYVEFATGDRLPGVVVESRSGNEDHYRPLPPHLIVRTALAFEPPENRPVAEIRVLTEPIRRIVWQRRPNLAYQPGTVHFRDGRWLPFSAVRLGSGEMQVLLNEGPRRLGWNDVAELHMPAQQVWGAWFDQLAALCPDVGTRLIQIETGSGLAATASLARFTARFEGNSADPDRWVHGLAPAWSHDILWIPFREIALYRSFAANEVPLTPLVARDCVQQTAIATAPRPQTNRSVHGSALTSGTREFGFGIGMAGGGRLVFELPPGARAMRTLFGLDRAAENGGCVRPRILLSDGSPPLWQGPVLVGSERVVDSLRLAMPPERESPPTPDGPRSLVLEVEPLLTDFPPGADPLDVRDFANWGQPLLELDPAAVEEELAGRLHSRFAAWRSWTLVPAKRSWPNDVRLAFQADGAIPGSFEPALVVRGEPLILRREVKLSEQNRWLVIAASRLTAIGSEPKLEVRVAGELAGTFALPVARRYSPELRPVAVDLLAYRHDDKGAAQIEIRQLGTDEGPPVQYWSIGVAPQLPTLYQLPTAQTRGLAASGTTIAARTGTDFSRPSLRLSGAERFRIELPEVLRVRAAPRWGEARFLRLAVKKPDGGRLAIELEDEQPRERPPRYDLGQGEPSYGGANRIFHRRLPDDWVVVTRDLFVDFGNIDLRAIIVGCPDGQSVEIGQLDLAATQADFALAAPAASAKATAAANQKEPPAVAVPFVGRAQLARAQLARAQSATVQLDFGGRRKASGVLIDDRGTILTAGHAASGGNSECRVTFAGGQTLRGRKRGLSRDSNLAMVVVSPPAGAAMLPLEAPRELRQNESFVAMLHLPSQQPTAKAEGLAVQLRRQAGAHLWTDLEIAGALFGGPLLDDSGSLVGLLTSSSSFGGLVATRLTVEEPAIERMRRGETFGSWPAGCEPLLGFPIAAEGEALVAKAISPDSLAAKAGLLAGDLLKQLDGRRVRTADDIRQILAEHDPGQQITIEVTRDNWQAQAQITLQPRVP